ncbi:MAG: RdgB/HAM1 family non-canonical purine NTP pyrophosphatase [Marinilabiliaceae bacterium]|nr:RdgB/HAM1 family non-canonical purine NTP pyrophosphatase [Marinilabiliaceae bacterium]
MKRGLELVFATNNLHKLSEIKVLCPSIVTLRSLSELGCDDDIPETGVTLSDNASQKAWYVYQKFGMSCFADDTGLEIEALNGAPGVYSARYAGEMRDALHNMSLVLQQMKGEENRRARFRTVISLIHDGEELQFEGIVNGVITESPMGEKGFGYDPIFMPDGFDATFAQLDLSVKNQVSHRGRAVALLIAHIERMLNGDA